MRSSRPSKRFLTIGDTILDMVQPQQKGDSTSYQPIGGGAIANVSRHLAEAGHIVEFITAFSPDPFGVMLRQQLLSLGVRLSHAQTVVESQTPLCFISNTDDGERFFLHRGGDPYRHLNVEANTLDVSNFDYFVWGISSLRTAESRFLVDRVIDNTSALVVCDPGSCPDWWGQPQALKVHLLERLHRIDILKCSLPEAQWLSGQTDPVDATRWLAQKKCKWVITTMGCDGLYFCAQNEDNLTHVAAKTVEALDTTGAGDATLAGFLDHLATTPTLDINEKLVTALETGVQWGSKTVQFQGAGPWFF
ncbi:MAG: carbohydrate kinase family protein [Bradymonadia bacterium]